MYVKFNYIIFKNLRSFGNNETKIDFTNGFHLITGKNGAGKTTILNAVSYNIFGVPLTDFKIDKLLNRHNKKGLHTESEFVIGSDVYLLIRDMKPNYIELQKNGVKLELLSSKKLIQDEIDKIIGINFKMFKNIVSLAISNNKSFLLMNSFEKRDMIENIFDIKIFSEMLKSVKKKNSEEKIDLKIYTEKERGLKNIINIYRKQKKDSDTNSQNFVLKKQEDLLEIETKINDKKSSIESNKSKILSLETSNKNLKSETKDIELYRKESTEIYNEYNKSIHDIQLYKEKLDLFKTNKSCPHCDSLLDNSETHLQAFNESIFSKENLSLDLKNALEIKKDIIKKLESKIDKIDSNKILIEKLEISTESLDDQIKEYLGRKNQIEETKNVFDLNDIEVNLGKSCEEYSLIYSALVEMNKSITSNDTIIEILSDHGIKSFFFKKLVPVLNTYINSYLQSIELDELYFVSFDEYLTERIVNAFGDEIEYTEFSEGEKKKIDSAIMLAFIDTAKIVLQWKTNILFIDEMFDTAVDQSGLDNLLQAMKNLATKQKEMCVYVISHKIQDSSLFNTEIKIEKVGKFSEIKYEDLKNG